MSVEQTQVIDVFSIDNQGDVILTISDHLPWDDRSDHILLLQEKINCYLAFIESGEIYDSRPDAKGKAITISIVALYDPNSTGRKFLEMASEIIKKAGFAFKFEQKDFGLQK